MKSVVVLLLLLFSFNKGNAATYVSKAQHNPLTPKQRYFDFRKHPHSFLIVDHFRLDNNTTITAFETRFAGSYQEATRGTDMDIWTVLFLDIPHQSKYKWMLYFDANTQKLKKASYINALN